MTCRLGACRTLDEICVTIINGVHRRTQNGLREKARQWLTAIRGLSVGPFGVQFNAHGNEDAVVTVFPDLLGKLISGLVGPEYDGLLIVLDETEQVAAIPGCGSFFKNLLETLRDPEAAERSKISFLMTVTPEGLDGLTTGHSSFPRLFRLAELDRLEPGEVDELVGKLLESGSPICSIDPEALETIRHYSDGFPGVVHELGYQAFESNDDDRISRDDVVNGIVGTNCAGALDSLYVKHFQKIYPGRLRSQKSEALLKEFIDCPHEIVSTKYLVTALKGKIPATNLGGYIKSFMERGTIAKVGEGQYKLASRLFGLYLRLRTRFGKLASSSSSSSSSSRSSSSSSSR